MGSDLLHACYTCMCITPCSAVAAHAAARVGIRADNGGGTLLTKPRRRAPGRSYEAWVLQNGKIVEPTDSKAVAHAIKDIIVKKDTWSRYSNNGIKNILAYSWPSHCIRYLKMIQTHRDDDSGGGGGTLPRVLTQSRLRHSIDDSIAAAIDPDDLASLADARKSDLGRQRVPLPLPPPPPPLPCRLVSALHRLTVCCRVKRTDAARPTVSKGVLAAV